MQLWRLESEGEEDGNGVSFSELVARGDAELLCRFN